MIKAMINTKIDNEVENKIIKILNNTNPVFRTRGRNLPNEHNEIKISNSVVGIDQLYPHNLMILETKVDRLTYDQVGKGLKPKLIINEQGERVLKLENYQQNGEEVAWAIAWVREKYL